MRNRFIVIIALLITLIALALYTVHSHPWISIEECLQNPDEFDGELVTHYHEPMIGEMFSDGFQLLQPNRPPIRVIADTTGLIQGKFLALRAIFHKEGYLEVVALHVSRNRRYKIGLSVLPVLFVGLLLIRFYRIDWKQCQIELRKNA